MAREHIRVLEDSATLRLYAKLLSCCLEFFWAESTASSFRIAVVTVPYATLG